MPRVPLSVLGLSALLNAASCALAILDVPTESPSCTGDECTCTDGGCESAACDQDCTVARCGDSTVNASAGEECDGGAGCDDDCQVVLSPVSATLIDDQDFVIASDAVAGELIGFAKPYPTLTLSDPSFAVIEDELGAFAIDTDTGEIIVTDPGALVAGDTAEVVVELETDGNSATAVMSILVLDPQTTAYIDPQDGGGPAEDGSREHPFDSWDDVDWQAGWAYLQKRGTTAVQTSQLYTGSNLTMGAYGIGERPELTLDTTDTYGIAVSNDQFVTIRDLAISAPQSTSVLYLKGPTNNGHRIVNCWIHDSAWGIRAMNGGEDIEILYTEISDIFDDAIYIIGITDVEIGYNHCHHINQRWWDPNNPDGQGGDCVQYGGSDSSDGYHIHHNLFDRSDTGNKFAIIIASDGDDEGIIEHNRLIGSTTFEHPAQGIYMKYTHRRTTIRYNTIENTSGAALFVEDSDEITLAYNLFYDVGGVRLSAHGGGNVLHISNNVFYRVDTGIRAHPDDSGEVYNNIFALADDGDVAFYYGSLPDWSCDYNLYAREGEAVFAYHSSFADWQSAGHGAHSLVAAPRFVNPAGRDFRLAADSPAIDAGLDVGWTTDFFGNPVFQGDGVDMGYAEHSP